MFASVHQVPFSITFGLLKTSLVEMTTELSLGFLLISTSEPFSFVFQRNWDIRYVNVTNGECSLPNHRNGSIETPYAHLPINWPTANGRFGVIRNSVCCRHTFVVRVRYPAAYNRFACAFHSLAVNQLVSVNDNFYESLVHHEFLMSKMYAAAYLINDATPLPQLTHSDSAAHFVFGFTNIAFYILYSNW